MKYRKLGHTGYDVSSIGFGTWQIAGGRWKSQPEHEVISLLNEANDLGVNIFDSAVVYGQYCDDNGFLQCRAQELLGKAFGNKRDQVIYCIKLGQFDEYTHRHDYDPKRVVQQLQQSLKRLKTDYIDICLIHAPSIHKIQQGNAITVLQTLQALGLVRSIGYSFEAEPEHAMSAIIQPIDVIMLQYNLLEQECEQVIEQARRNGIGVLVGGPFKRGYLTGKYKNIEDLPNEDDYWNWNINRNKLKVADILDQVKQLLQEHKTPEKLRRQCLQFILNHPGVSSCIIGHRNIAEVVENIKSSLNELNSMSFNKKLNAIKVTR